MGSTCPQVVSHSQVHHAEHMHYNCVILLGRDDDGKRGLPGGFGVAKTCSPPRQRVYDIILRISKSAVRGYTASRSATDSAGMVVVGAMRMIRYGLSFLLMLNAAGFAWQRAQEPEYIGIDFVQFHFTGQHVVTGGDTHVYADDVRAEILDSAWQQILTEGIESRCSYAVDFRHQRSWETYSSPFLYAVFGVMAGRESGERIAGNPVSLATPSSGLSATVSPEPGEKGQGEAYEAAIDSHWIICLGSTMVGFMAFGCVLRIPCWSMLLGAMVLVWFSPLRSDMNVANVNQIQFGMVGVLAVILGMPVGVFDESKRRYQIGSPNQEAHHAERDGYFGREFLAGIWLGICVAFKPSLLWCGVMWFGAMIVDGLRTRHQAERDESTGRRRLIGALTGGLIGGLMAILFSAIWFPLQSWIDWIEAVRSLPDAIIQTEQGNFSPTYYAWANHFPEWLLTFSGPAMVVGVFTIAMIQRRRMNGSAEVDSIHSESRSEDRSGTNAGLRYNSEIVTWLAIGCQIHLLTSNLVWYHYFVLSLPATLIVLRQAAVSVNRLEKCAIGVTVLWCLMLLGLEPIDGILF